MINSNNYKPESLSTAGTLNPVGPAANEDAMRTVPLTEAQREIWYAAQMSDTVSCSFNVSVVANLRGSLDVPRLRRSICRLVERHEALRISFAANGEEQHVHRTMPVDLPVVDLSILPPESRQHELQERRVAVVNQPFHLAQGPLWRAQLIRLAPEEHVFLLAVHHIVCDGSSLNVLLQELGEHYSAESRGEPPPSREVPSFANFVLEQESARLGSKRKITEAYWLKLYSQPAPVLELPADHPRSSKWAFTGASQTLMLQRELTQELKRFSGIQRCSLATTLLAGYQLLLHHLSRQSEIIVGLPMTSRSGESGEFLVGHCVNFLPLRMGLERDMTFNELLGRVRQVLLEVHEHHNFTLASLLQKMKLPRGVGRMPLVAVMFNLDWVHDQVGFAGLENSLEFNPPGYCRYDLSFSFVELKGLMQLQCQYNAELFKEVTVQRWLRDYEIFLSAIVTDSGQRLAEICQLASRDGRQLPESSPSFVPETAAATEMAECTASAEPTDATEQALAQIWREVLGLDEIGRDDDFFDLGGHSLLAVQILSRVTKVLHVRLPLRVIFDSPTIATLALQVAQAKREQPGALSIPRGTREAKNGKLLERLEQFSEAELQALLHNPKLKDILQ